MARFIPLVACIVLLSFSLGATDGSWHSHDTIAGKGTVTYKPTNLHPAENHSACNGGDKFTSQFTIEWLRSPHSIGDIDGANARITYQLKLSDQTYNIADIELRDRRVIYRGRNSVDNSTLMFKVFARNTTDDVFTQEIGTATAFISFYNFGLLVNLTNSDGQIVNFSFSGGGYWYPSSGGYWKGSLLGGVMGMDNCRMTWDDKVVSTATNE